MIFALISNGNKPNSLVVHDPKGGRLVFKGPVEGELQRSFDQVVNKPVVATEVVNGLQIRHKLPKTDPNYLKKLLDGFVHYPYRVTTLEEVEGSHRLDSLADSLEEKHLNVTK